MTELTILTCIGGISHDVNIQLDLETYFKLFFWPGLYSTVGTPSYMETCFHYKQVHWQPSLSLCGKNNQHSKNIAR